MFLYVGEYESVDEAKADLDALKALHHEHVVGTYDAAVVTKNEEGKVKIVDKIEKPTQHGGGAGLAGGAAGGRARGAHRRPRGRPRERRGQGKVTRQDREADPARRLGRAGRRRGDRPDLSSFAPGKRAGGGGRRGPHRARSRRA